jgi:hypothetical protein
MEKLKVNVKDGKLVLTKSEYPEFYLESNKDYFLVSYLYTTGDSENSYKGILCDVEIFYTKEDAYLLVEMIEIHRKWYQLKDSYQFRKAKDKEVFMKPYIEAMNAEFDNYEDYGFTFKGKIYRAKYNGYFESLDAVFCKQVNFDISTSKKYNLT